MFDKELRLSDVLEDLLGACRAQMRERAENAANYLCAEARTQCDERLSRYAFARVGRGAN